MNVENQCDGKIRYNSYDDCVNASIALNKKGGLKLHYYKCDLCGFYHIGHPKKYKLHKHQKIKNPDFKKFNHKSKTHVLEKKYAKKFTK